MSTKIIKKKVNKERGGKDMIEDLDVLINSEGGYILVKNIEANIRTAKNVIIKGRDSDGNKITPEETDILRERVAVLEDVLSTPEIIKLNLASAGESADDESEYSPYDPYAEEEAQAST